jgi:hypothetical protein
MTARRHAHHGARSSNDKRALSGQWLNAKPLAQLRMDE